jgi:NAD(P)-dependent dehydrogenase (short-subunit alcohol dehydrogenase family)
LSQELGFYSLLNLAKAIGEQNISAPVSIGIVTSQIHEVTGEEKLNPAMATILGPCGVMPKEYPNITSFSVDLPAVPSAHQGLDETVFHLLGEFGDPPKGGVIAYRGAYRWERSFKSHPLPALTSRTGDEGLKAQGLRRRGVYLITGGTGGIGLAIAKYLAETCQARLVLTKKTPFPEKSVWRQQDAAGGLSDSDRRVISALLEIEALGGEVDVYTCDASNPDSMQRTVAKSMAKHQVINGVIHAAGILRDGMIQVKTRESVDSVLRPKVNGTFILYDIFKSIDLDILVLFSSISSVVAFHGQSDYRAANAFLDAFSYFSNSRVRPRTLAINWPAWREVGILTRLKTPPGLESWKEATLRRAILTQDGLEVFKRALSSNLAQVIVSPLDLNVMLQESSESPLDSFNPAPVASRPMATRPEGTNDGPQNEVEHALADIWSSVLGVAPIGIHESFLDLGGHSLLAMQIVSRIRSAFQMNFTLRNFFESPTVAKMSVAIQVGVAAEIEGMTDEEVKRLMSDSVSR